MIDLEKEALVLFRDHSHLILKSFKISEEEKLKGTSGGTEPYELLLLNKALEYHKYYNSIKILQSNRK